MELQRLEWHAGVKSCAKLFGESDVRACGPLEPGEGDQKVDDFWREIAELLGRIDLAGRRCARCGLWRHSG